jgi:EAL domain-containing protein (putative c-di-GMP-specific phosphodiesterase class I)
VPLVEALRNHWLEVWYQAKVDLGSFAITGAEALIRARHPSYGIITPDRLLPPAGDANYQPLTELVIRQAADDWAQFVAQGLSLKLSVNVPASVLQKPSFVPLLRSLLPRNPRFPGLVLEVTEDEVVHDAAWAHEIATQLKLYEVGISIDDFGSGYASLSRLNELPFVEVKIDRGFVLDCSTNQLKRGLCQTVIDLTHRFGAKVCAEGVETVEDLHALMSMKCDMAQGFLFARPLPAGAFVSAALARSPSVMREQFAVSADEDPPLAQTA